MSAFAPIPIEIAKADADQIIAASLNQPMRAVVACYQGQWYDVRHMSEAEIEAWHAGIHARLAQLDAMPIAHPQLMIDIQPPDDGKVETP